MDQHPIPQDVTGFQFKLIGAMTVKQFGFVAVGVIMAVVIYYINIDNILWLFAKFLLIPLCGGSGVIVAFVPIDGRPIDVMTNNFVKALFSPNQYIYKREGIQLSFMKVTTAAAQVKEAADNKSKGVTASTTASRKANDLDQKEAKLRAFLMSSQGGIRNDLDKKEAAFLKSFAPPPMVRPATPAGAQRSMPVAKPVVKQVVARPVPPPPHLAAPAPVMTPPAALTPNPAPIPAVAPQPQMPTPISVENQTPQAKEAALTQQENLLAQQLTQAKQEEAASQAPAAHQKVETLAKQIEEIHAQKQQLEQELSQLKSQLATQKAASPAPLPAPTAVASQPQSVNQDPQHVRTISQDVSKKAGLPHVSDTANVVVGIVKDPRGNILPNILVEVKDKDGNPVRAFKTNTLGQFASATPLSAGTYTMELEDPKKQNRFDIIQITANNQILPAMEVISHDAREDLRKQLFAS